MSDAYREFRKAKDILKPAVVASETISFSKNQKRTSSAPVVFEQPITVAPIVAGETRGTTDVRGFERPSPPMT
jgi:hypothetical protein